MTHLQPASLRPARTAVGRPAVSDAEPIGIRGDRACFVAALVWTVLAALPQAAAAQEEAEIEEIIVTGSYLRRDKFDMASPVEVVDAGDILTSGYTSIGPFIRDLTYTENVDTVANVLSVADGQQDSNSARFNLRGLGTSSTLTLFDGRRVLNSGAVAGILPDIALQRVEVILDGGAATYGTDAVAGVVNFLPVKQFDGLKVRAFYSEDTRGDVPEPKGSVLWGRSFGTVDVVAAMEYSERKDALYRSDRPKYLDADNDTTTTGMPGTFTGPVSFLGFGVDPGCGTYNEGATDDSRPGSYPSGEPALPITIGPFVIPAVCAWEYGEFQDYLRPNEDLVGYLGTTWEVSDRVSLEFQLNYNLRDSLLISSPSTGERGSNDLLTIPGSHPANPFTIIGTPFPASVTPRGWRPFGKTGATLPSHLDSRGADNTTFTYETVIASAGTTFELGDTGWNGEVWLSRQQSTTDIEGHALRRSRLAAALQGEGGPNGDQWFNPFASASPRAPDFVAGEIGQGGTANDQGLVDWLYTPYDYESLDTDYWSIEGFVSGAIATLPAGDVLLAVGAQYRDTKFVSRDNPVDEESDNYNSSPVNPPGSDTTGESAVQSVFFEVDLPIVTDLTLNLAGRYEDFKDLELDAFVPKAALRYQPLETLSLRASYGEGFLAPTVTELTPDPTPGCAELFTGTNPFDGANLTGALSCASGNPELDPEESEIWNVGFTWRPLGDLELSLDYQEIDYSDRIVRLGTEDTLRKDLANFLQVNGLTQQQYEDLDPATAEGLRTGWYATGSDPNITRDGDGTVLQVVRIPGNVAVMKVNVIDFRLNYGAALGDIGYLSADLAHTQYTKYDYEDAFGTLTDAVGNQNGRTDVVPPMPRYRTNLRLTWLKNNHMIGITTRYTPAIDFDSTPGPAFGPEAVTDVPDEIDSYTVVDVRYSYLFDGLWGGSLGLAAGLNNAFDEDAQPLPVLGGLETRLQNPLGRTYFLELTYTLE